MKKALVAMSGGVDSSVTAYILKQQGYDCIGITFTMFDKRDPLFGFDPSDADNDINDAKAVCDKVGIPFIAADASNEFRKYVISDFIRTFKSNFTCITYFVSIIFCTSSPYFIRYKCFIFINIPSSF